MNVFPPSFITLRVVKVIHVQKQIILNTEKNKRATVIHSLTSEKSSYLIPFNFWYFMIKLKTFNCISVDSESQKIFLDKGMVMR